MQAATEAQATPTKRLKVLPWVERTGLTARNPMRMLKLVRPRCRACSTQGPGWQNRCPHDPFHAWKYEQDEDSNPVIDAAGNKVRQRLPNIIQVPLTVRVDSGLSVEMMLAKGCRFPEDVTPVDFDTGEPDPEFDGYQSTCEFANCYAAPDPRFSTRHQMLGESEFRHIIPTARYAGHYCSERHAKLARLKDSEFPRYDPSGPGGRRDSQAHRQQVESVVL